MLKFGSQLRWLFSETFVIVLGVLIALGLNDYWTYRQERELELQYLKRIHEDVRADIEFTNEFFYERLNTKLRAFAAIAPIVRGQQPVPEDVETFLRNVALAGLLGASSRNWATADTFEDLKSTGNLRLIRDADLRREISRYYDIAETTYIRNRDRQTGYVAYVHSLLPAELRDDMDFAAMEDFGVERALTRILSPEFQDLMNQEYNHAVFFRNLDLGTPSQRLAKRLEAYIRELEAD